MFESLFSILKSSRQQAAARQHHFEGMTKQKSSSPPSPVAKVIYQQPDAPDQMQQLHLRGGGEGADICFAPGLSASSAAPAASVVDGVFQS
ncbi:hypothetical protein E8E15_001186 [Penicillium rubens]|nr:hypothetical protein E8E15_001186 [Penicillium rubens]